MADRAPVKTKPCCYCLVAKSCPTLCDLMDCSPPGSSVLGISQAEYCSGLPFPSPGDLPDLVIKPASSAWQAGSSPLSHLRLPLIFMLSPFLGNLVHVRTAQNHFAMLLSSPVKGFKLYKADLPRHVIINRFSKTGIF